LKDSSSAKIIGNNIFYYIKGKPVLQEQKISLNRLEQLRKALLLKTPKKRSDEDYVEVYMHSGERIAIFGGDLVYEGQPAIAFRKYIIDKLTLEEQAVRGTIPEESIPFLKASVQCGFNCSFVGPVRCGKTTMLATMQTYEYKALEGVAIQTDPEIPFHEYYPDYPIINIIVDGEEMKDIGKKVVRLDPDYILMTEARDGYAFNLVVEMTNIGAIRCKTTMHLRDIDKFCYKMASKIQQVYGGALEYHLWNVADSYHYIYEMMCLPHNRDKKRLKGIYELRFNSDNNMIEFHQICKYDITTDSWTFKYDIGNRIAKLACEENLAAFNVFKSELERLSKMYPMDGDNVIIPFYSKLLGRGIN
jgi:pilus assembly protein CpaF